jgi:hypothetical protein
MNKKVWFITGASRDFGALVAKERGADAITAALKIVAKR